MSDPKPIAGFDCTFNVAPYANQIKAINGAVGRYYSFSSWKNLTRAEAATLSQAGIQVWAVWEAQGDDPSSFTGENGQAHAQEALKQAAAVGQPQGSGIYFAVDFDPSPQHIPDLMPYFRAIGGTLGAKYRAGVYGSGDVCSTMKTNGLVSLTWLAGAGGWSGSHAYADWNIRQYPPAMHPTIHQQIDPDICVGDFGGFLVTQVTQPAELPELFVGVQNVEMVKLLQTKLLTKGFDPLGIDGVFGRGTWTALTRFQKSAGLVADGIAGPQTWTALG